MAHIVCIAGPKGGTGKTTTAVNLAVSLALFEKKTLLVDADPLGHATTAMGVCKEDLQRDFFSCMAGVGRLSESWVPTGLDFLRLVPARYESHAARFGGTAGPGAFLHLHDCLLEASQEWEFVLLDTPPAMSPTAASVIAAADWLLIPMQCQIFTLESLQHLLEAVKTLHRNRSTGPKIAGLLLTMCESGDERGASVTHDVLGRFGRSLIRTVIPRDRRLQDAADDGRPLVLQDIMAPGAKAYLHLGLELIDFFEDRRRERQTGEKTKVTHDPGR